MIDYKSLASEIFSTFRPVRRTVKYLKRSPEEKDREAAKKLLAAYAMLEEVHEQLRKGSEIHRLRDVP